MKDSLRSFYPRNWSAWITMKSTASVEVTAGDLTIGNSYFIKTSGDDSTSFDGAITNKEGEGFTATGTSAVYNGAVLVDITEGKPTEIGFYYGHPKTLQTKWTLGYNTDGDCIFTNIYDANNNQIDR